MNNHEGPPSSGKDCSAATPTEEEDPPIWYYQRHDVTVAGPFSASAFVDLAKRGEIDGLTAAWMEGMKDWTPVSEIPELKSKLLTSDADDEDEDDLQFATELPSAPIAPPEDAELSEFLAAVGEVPMLDPPPPQQTDSGCSPEAPVAEEEGNKELEEKQKRSENRKRYHERLKKRKLDGEYVKAKSNPNVYVTNLPLDVTMVEVENHFKRAGVIQRDPETMQPRIRIYQDEEGNRKGDALVSFVMQESVPLAVKYLDSSALRPNAIINVSQAKFDEAKFKERKGTLGAASKRDKKKLLAAKLEQKRLLSWNDDSASGVKGRSVVVLKPLWTLEQAKTEDMTFYSKIVEKVTEAFEPLGPLKKVSAMQGHPQGVVCIRYEQTSSAEAAIDWAQGKTAKTLFVGEDDTLELQAHFYDGITDLKSQCLARSKRPVTRHPRNPSHPPPHGEALWVSPEDEAPLSVFGEATAEAEIRKRESHEADDMWLEEEDEQEDENELLEEFGRELEDESSDEEFLIREE